MTAVPVPRTWAAGEVITSSRLNVNISDVLTFLSNPPITQVRQTSVQSLTSGSQSVLLFDAEDVDSSGMHSTSSNTGRATAVYPGWYQFSGGVGIATNATGRRGFRFMTNGTTVVPGSPVMYFPASAGQTEVAGRTVLIFLNVGDYVEAQAFQDSGGALNTTVIAPDQPAMTCKWVSN